MENDLNVVVQNVTGRINKAMREINFFSQHNYDVVNTSDVLASIKEDNGRKLWGHLYQYDSEFLVDNYALIDDIMEHVDNKAKAYQIIAATVLAKELMIYNDYCNTLSLHNEYEDAIDDLTKSYDERLSTMVDYLTSSNMTSMQLWHLSKQLLIEPDLTKLSKPGIVHGGMDLALHLHKIIDDDFHTYHIGVVESSNHERVRGSYTHDVNLMNKHEFSIVAALHKDWLQGKSWGKQADFSNRTLLNLDMAGVRLDKAKLNNVFIDGCDMSFIHLTDADLSGSMIVDSNVAGAHMNGCITMDAKYCNTKDGIDECYSSNYTFNYDELAIPLTEYLATVPELAMLDLECLRHNLLIKRSDLEFQDNVGGMRDAARIVDGNITYSVMAQFGKANQCNTHYAQNLQKQAAFDKAEALCSNIESEDVEQDCEYED